MKKYLGVVLAGLLLICVFFLGKSLGSIESVASLKNNAVSEERTEQNFRISFIPNYDVDAGFTTIPLERGNYQDVTYLGMDNVTIDIDGTNMNLEDALLKGYISVDELVADVRKVAGLGLCRERAASENGLTVFTYYYGEFNVRYVYDVYETPANGKRLITDFLIYESRREPQFTPSEDEHGVIIDYEDWGIDFEVSKVDPSGITIRCSQSGGQQIGELNIGGYLLSRKDPDTLALKSVQTLNDENAPFSHFTGIENWEPDVNNFLIMGGTKEVSFDFTQVYGELPAGEYVINLQIIDFYNVEEVPSLMRNFHDEQWYVIDFSIV